MQSRILIVIILFISFITLPLHAKHRVLIQGNGKLALVEEDGSISWSKDWGGIHDIHYLKKSNTVMLQRQMRQVVELDLETGKELWKYDSSTANGNEGKRIEVHAFQPLANGNVMIAESVAARIIEVNRDFKLLKKIKLVVDNPNPHRDTRLARKIENGNYLACHEADGTLREYDGDTGEVVWEYTVPLFNKDRKGGHGPEAFGNQLFSAVRLKNGNTLIGTGNGHSVIEVTPEKEVVWQIHQDDLPGIRLAWVTTLEVLKNGNVVIGNCHAGPGQPLLVEVNRKTKEVVWTLDMFDTFGNSVPNSVLIDQAGRSRR